MEDKLSRRSFVTTALGLAAGAMLPAEAVAQAKPAGTSL